MGLASERSIRGPTLWGLIAIAHGAAAAYAWRMLPRGFAVGHPRFWINEVLPIALVVVSTTCVVALWRKRERLAAPSIALLTCLHAGMAVCWKLAFPITGAAPALMSTVVAVVLVTCAIASLRQVREARRTIVVGAVVGLVVGAAVPWAQRGSDPATHPAGLVRDFGHPDLAIPAASLPAWVDLIPEAGVIRIHSGAVELAIQPLLSFYSRSPDRGWTVFASARDRIGPQRRYVGTSGETSYYAGDEPSVLRVTANDALHLDAQTTLKAAVYAHLDSFCVLEIRGQHHLSVAFSPMPDQRIEVTYSEYPTGRPSRFAYLDAEAMLHVVESTSGEKGPFHELAHGPLPAAGPLGITLFDDDTPIAHLDLADFAAQASTQPSPTAGWGVPENAIEFSLGADRPDAPASFFVTLAATSVGRGWDSVGHAPGLYRNRIDIRPGP